LFHFTVFHFTDGFRPEIRCVSDDAHVSEAAIAAQASRLAVFNTGDFTGASQLGVEVMTPGELLHAIE
jgi:hypothetical protein